MKRKPKKKKVGRPSLYVEEAYYDGANNLIENTEDMVYRLALLGTTQEELAIEFNVSVSTIEKWVRTKPGFKRALRRGGNDSDTDVANSLYKRACGYSHPDIHISSHLGIITITPIIKHYPPDVTAICFWLKNRQKEAWRDVHRQEHTGPNGGPIQVQPVAPVDLSDLTDEQLKVMKEIGMKQIKASHPGMKLIKGNGTEG